MRTTMLCLLLLAACADPPTPPGGPDAAPPYSLTWSCLVNCAARPDLTGTTTLAVDHATLTYAGGPGGEVHATTEGAGGCLDVAGAHDGSRGAYQICPVGTGLEAMIRWGAAVWRVQAWR